MPDFSFEKRYTKSGISLRDNNKSGFPINFSLVNKLGLYNFFYMALHTITDNSVTDIQSFTSNILFIHVATITQ
jgi:hypothetical protein